MSGEEKGTAEPGCRTKVYIAGPYTKGDVAMNVRTALQVATNLWSLRFAPYCPHLTHFWHLLFPQHYETWLEMDNEWVVSCDVLLRIPGESSGADKEVELARSLEMPVFFSYEELIRVVPSIGFRGN